MTPETKILVVDDNENNRYTLKRRLTRLNYKHIVEAEDGFVALELLESELFDIVLLDVMMLRHGWL
ncbi:response regulator [Psychrosphaera algicola]|uniref:Response regulator n=1 Tax=Psychrosphaera algicola TaxID=3023714 RepID=A0ABT5FE62_9GAMM|nr:response regulator [Psychrosphaera sp. G1-22]MDC2889846.1 response regulator [Psychrosphaera sp. G1-22]